MPSGRIQFEDFTLDCDRYELLRAGQSIKLEKLPMELLILLVDSDGRLVTRQEIIERLWGQDVFLDTEHGINTAIFKLRSVLGDNADKSRFIQTVTGKGYRFVASASPISNGADTSSNNLAPAADASSSVAVATPVQIAEQVPATQRATPARWWKKTVAVIGGIAGLMALVGLIDSGISSEPAVRILDSRQITYSTEHKDAPLVTRRRASLLSGPAWSCRNLGGRWTHRAAPGFHGRNADAGCISRWIAITDSKAKPGRPKPERRDLVCAGSRWRAEESRK